MIDFINSCSKQYYPREKHDYLKILTEYFNLVFPLLFLGEPLIILSKFE